jgi:hypothetical protein
MFPRVVEKYEAHAGYLTVLTRHFTRPPGVNWVRLPVSTDDAELGLVSEDAWESCAPWCDLRRDPRTTWWQVAAERSELEVILCLVIAAFLPAEVAEIVAALAAWAVAAEKGEA